MSKDMLEFDIKPENSVICRGVRVGHVASLGGDDSWGGKDAINRCVGLVGSACFRGFMGVVEGKYHIVHLSGGEEVSNGGP